MLRNGGPDEPPDAVIRIPYVLSKIIDLDKQSNL